MVASTEVLARNNSFPQVIDHTSNSLSHYAGRMWRQITYENALSLASTLLKALVVFAAVCTHPTTVFTGLVATLGMPRQSSMFITDLTRGIKNLPWSKKVPLLFLAFNTPAQTAFLTCVYIGGRYGLYLLDN